MYLPEDKELTTNLVYNRQMLLSQKHVSNNMNYITFKMKEWIFVTALVVKQ